VNSCPAPQLITISARREAVSCQARECRTGGAKLQRPRHFAVKEIIEIKPAPEYEPDRANAFVNGEGRLFRTNSGYPDELNDLPTSIGYAESLDG
jgi:hypothetical protein